MRASDPATKAASKPTSLTRRFRLGSTFLLLSALAPLLQGCIGIPETETMQADPTCHLWNVSGMGKVAVQVGDTSARLYGGQKWTATWLNEQHFEIDGGFMNTFRGQYRTPYVIYDNLKGNVSVHVMANGAKIEGAKPAYELAANPVCTEAQIALGSALIAAEVAERTQTRVGGFRVN